MAETLLVLGALAGFGVYKVWGIQGAMLFYLGYITYISAMCLEELRRK